MNQKLVCATNSTDISTWFKQWLFIFQPKTQFSGLDGTKLTVWKVNYWRAFFNIWLATIKWLQLYKVIISCLVCQLLWCVNILRFHSTYTLTACSSRLIWFTKVPLVRDWLTDACYERQTVAVLKRLWWWWCLGRDYHTHCSRFRSPCTLRRFISPALRVVDNGRFESLYRALP